MGKYFLFATFCFLCSCSKLKKIQQANNKKIVGVWSLRESSSTFYYNLEFNNNGAVFYTRGDTILFYAYGFSKKNILLLRDRNGNKTYNKVLKLTQDTLIFESLLHERTSHFYIRDSLGGVRR